MTECRFVANSAAAAGETSSYASRGGALFADRSSRLHLIDTVFTNNTARYSGSAVYVTDTAALSFSRCSFTESPAAPAGQSAAPFFRLRSLYHTFFVCFSHCLSYLTSAYGASPSATLAPSALSVCTVLRRRRRRRRRCSSNNGNSDVIATLCRHCCYDFTSVAHALLRRCIVV